jgi:2-oxoisovalerate dehydrogenase E1 component
MSRLLVDATLRWLYPVLFLEHKLLYGEKQDRADYRELPARAEDVAAHLFPTLVRGGDEPDLTLVTYGGMLPVVEAAAGYLEEEEELEVEILVPSLLSPLSKTGLIGHLLDRPGVVIVEESHHDFGVSAEIGASLLDRGYTGRFLRIGTPPVPIASARSLERQILPDEETLIEQILDWIQ